MSSLCFFPAGGYIFNTEAHPVDGAALYCCSAQKKEDDLLLLKLHENVDLLSLLKLTDSTDGLFTKKLPKKSHPAVRLKSMKNENFDPQHMGPPHKGSKTPLTQQIVLDTAPGYPMTTGQPEEPDVSNTADSSTRTDDSETGKFSDTKRKIIEELTAALKGTSFENLDSAMGDILKAMDEKVSYKKSPKSTQQVREDEPKTDSEDANLKPPTSETPSTQSTNTVENPSENPSESSNSENDDDIEDEEMCSSKDENRLWEIDPSEAARQMFLLTCPARPFTARFTIQGEFMPTS